MKKVSYKRWIGACAVMAVLLTGCGAKPSTDTSSAASNAAAGTGQQDQQSGQNNGQTKANGTGQGARRAAMNPQQRQMMLEFQSLMAMDKANGLAITKDEAAQLLPIVQASVKNGQLSSDDQSQIEGKLTPDQKKFVDDNIANIQQRMQNRGNGANGGGKGGKGQSGGTNSDAGGTASGSSNDNGNANGGDTSSAKNSDSGKQANGNGNGQGQNRNGYGGRNIGDQLVQLLQTRSQ